MSYTIEHAGQVANLGFGGDRAEHALCVMVEPEDLA